MFRGVQALVRHGIAGLVIAGSPCKLPSSSPLVPGDIPQETKFDYHATCWSKFQGLCATRDGPCMKQLKRLRHALQKDLEEGSWYKVHAESAAEPEQQPFYIFAAYRRRGSPQVTVLVEAVREGDDHVLLDQRCGQLRFCTAAMLSRELLHCDSASPSARVKRVWAQKLLTAALPGNLLGVACTGFGPPLQVFAASKKYALQKDMGDEQGSERDDAEISAREAMFSEGLFDQGPAKRSKKAAPEQARLCELTAGASSASSDDFSDAAGEADGEDLSFPGADEDATGLDAEMEALAECIGLALGGPPEPAIADAHAAQAAAPQEAEGEPAADVASDSSAPGVPAPSQLGHAGPAPSRPRHVRAADWGWEVGAPFAIAPVYSQGAHVGFVAMCRLHRNAADLMTACCKKHLWFGERSGGKLSPEECQVHLKRWLIHGLEVPPDGIASRTNHVKINARHGCADWPAPGDLDTVLAERFSAWSDRHRYESLAKHCPSINRALNHSIASPR